MKSIRSTRPAARKAAKTTAKRSATVKAKKAGGGTVAKKAGASLRGTARVSASARAELTSLLDSIHYNLDQTEALLADWRRVAAWDDLKAVALALHRLSESEKKLAELAAENKAAVKELRATMQELRERQLKIETRLDALDEIVTTKAQATAALAVAQALAPIMERLARLESQPPPPPRLPPPAG